MRFLFRSIGSVASGMVLAFVIVLTAEIVNSRFYPLPPGVDLTNSNSLRDFMASLPGGAFILILLGWAIGTFLGVWLASRLSRRVLHGVIVGVLLLIFGIMNLLSLPHPGWVWAVGLMTFPTIGYAASRLGTGKTVTE